MSSTKKEALHDEVLELEHLYELTDDVRRLSQISDTGVGFDVEQGRASKGLGLVSMEERVRLVGGTLLLQSHPGKGTELQVLVPAKGAA